MKRWPFMLVTFGFGCAVASVPIDSGTGGGPTGGPTGGSTTGGSTTGGSGGSGGNTPTGPWIVSTGNLAKMPSVCGTLRWMSAKPDEDLLIAGVSLKGLWGSTDGGASWKALGVGAGSATIDNRISSIVYDPANPARYWQTGIYEGHGVFETKDKGTTFTQLGSVTHVDMVSVDFTDPARKFMLAGGHEQTQTLHRSTDGGMTWTDVGKLLPAGKGCNSPLVFNATTVLAGCGGPFSGGGILRSTDGAMTWTEVSKTGGTALPLRASDGTIYWAPPVGQPIVHSTDDGKTWTESPTIEASFIAPIQLPDGRIATIGGHFVIASADKAMTWTKIVQLPYQADGLTYSAQRKAIYVWRAACDDPALVPDDAIMRFDYDAAAR